MLELFGDAAFYIGIGLGAITVWILFSIFGSGKGSNDTDPNTWKTKYEKLKKAIEDEELKIYNLQIDFEREVVNLKESNKGYLEKLQKVKSTLSDAVAQISRVSRAD